jgi:hypothetical protein
MMEGSGITPMPIGKRFWRYRSFWVEDALSIQILLVLKVSALKQFWR